MKCLGCVFTFLLALPIAAQVAGRISGSVIDASGAAVPNAKVDLYLSGGKTAVLSTTTTVDGNYTIATVRPDQYDLVVDAAGFTQAKVSGIHVEPSIVTSVAPVTLEVASTS